MTVLMQQVDVGKALDLLTMFKEAGKEKIDVRTDVWRGSVAEISGKW